jgi:hypothetical protein
MAKVTEKKLTLFFVPVGKRAGTVDFTIRYKSTGYPTRDAAEAMMVRAMVNGSPLCVSVGEGIRLYCNADAFLAEEPKNQAGLAGQFFFVRVDEYGNLATLGKERQKLCNLWLKTRDIRAEIIEAHEEMERYRAEVERLYGELDDDEPESE